MHNNVVWWRTENIYNRWNSTWIAVINERLNRQIFNWIISDVYLSSRSQFSTHSQNISKKISEHVAKDVCFLSRIIHGCGTWFTNHNSLIIQQRLYNKSRRRMAKLKLNYKTTSESLTMIHWTTFLLNGGSGMIVRIVIYSCSDDGYESIHRRISWTEKEKIKPLFDMWWARDCSNNTPWNCDDLLSSNFSSYFCVSPKTSLNLLNDFYPFAPVANSLTESLNNK